MKFKHFLKKGIAVMLGMALTFTGVDFSALTPKTVHAETVTEDSVADVYALSINDGSDIYMNYYLGGLREAKCVLDEGVNTYTISKNGIEIKNGTITGAANGESIYIRYQNDTVLTSNDSDFIYAATWCGNFSDFRSGGSVGGNLSLPFSGWSPSDTRGNLEYIGGGCFLKTFDYTTSQNISSLNYKIAFSNDWAYAVPGANKQTLLSAGSNSITLWANSFTAETYDSVNDPDANLGTEIIVSIEGETLPLIQVSKNGFIGTIVLGADTYHYTSTKDTAATSNEGDFTLAAQSSVTFIYNAADDTLFNSANDAEILNEILLPSDTTPADLDAFAYDGDDLGAVYTETETTFKVWAPTATNVELKLYATGSDDEPGAAVIDTITMEQDLTAGEWLNGIWTATVAGDQANVYYTYLVTTVNGYEAQTNETGDVYAKAAGVSGDRSMVVDLDATNPTGWDLDTHVSTDEPTDAIIWEVHVRDFSESANSGITNKGKYMAFTEQGTKLISDGSATSIATGIDYLKELGINYVQLLPVFDQANDETNDDYNWGYNPKNYNVPEGSYSSNPFDGNVRITEFKEMVMALHDANIGVIMDVVYNHVGGDAKTGSWFNRTVPNYYFRLTSSGSFSNGSGCGNETASERAMFRKYMIDSISYWATEYHIDGFRFDLMGCHDTVTMNQIRDTLDLLPDGDKILTYGEPWTGGATAEDEGVILANQKNINLLDLRIGAFNDQLRDSLKGHIFNADATGFIQGGINTPQSLHDGEPSPTFTNEDVMQGILGSTKAVAGATNSSVWALAPSQCLSYNSVHDNHTLWDKLMISVNGTSGEYDGDFAARDNNLVAMNKLAASAVLTSQGMALFQAGEEMARTKSGDENSYQSPISVNQIDWNRLSTFADLNEYYKGLITLRKKFAPFTASDMSTVDATTFSTDNIDNVVAYTIENPSSTGWQTVAVLMNANQTAQSVTLETASGVVPSDWIVVADGDHAGITKLSGVSGTTISIPAQSTLVLVDRDSYKASYTPNVIGITLNHSSKELTVNGTVQLTPTVTPSDAALKACTWSSSDETVAKVSASGLVTAKKVGSCTITATAIDGSEVMAQCTITVVTKVASITLNSTNKTLGLNETYQLNATVNPTNATNKTVTWSTSNNTIATVSASTGLVTAKKAGTCIIYATANDGSGVRAQCTITVITKATSVTLNSSSKTLDLDDTYQLTATVSPAATSNKAVTWSTSNNTVATVSSTGKITAKKAGSCTITVTTADGTKLTATCKITVKNQKLLAKGKKYTDKNSKLVYQVTKSSKTKGEVTIYGVSSKNITKATIPATIKIQGYTYKVTAISKNAFKGCSKLKTITVKSNNITSVGKDAFKGIHKNATIKVNKSKLSAYTKLFKNKGQAATVKIKK